MFLKNCFRINTPSEKSRYFIFEGPPTGTPNPEVQSAPPPQEAPQDSKAEVNPLAPMIAQVENAENPKEVATKTNEDTKKLASPPVKTANSSLDRLSTIT